jgi:phosphatidylinositol glycan class Q protein
MRVFVPLHLVRDFAAQSGVLFGWHDAHAGVVVCVTVLPSDETALPDWAAVTGDAADDALLIDQLCALLFGVAPPTAAAQARTRHLLRTVGKPTLLGSWCSRTVPGVRDSVLHVRTCNPDDGTVCVDSTLLARGESLQLVYFEAPFDDAFFADATTPLTVDAKLWLAAESAAAELPADQFATNLAQMAHVRAVGALVGQHSVPTRWPRRAAALLRRWVVVRVVSLLAWPIAALLWLQLFVGRTALVGRVSAVSHFAAALCERAELAKRWTARAALLREEPRCDVATRRLQSMRALQLRDDAVRVCVDVLLGVAASLVLVLVARDVTPSLAAVEAWLTHDVVRKMIVWMMGWPAGFKLNGPLSRFVGELFLLFVDSWTTVVLWCGVRHVPSPLFVVALVGPVGLSVQLALTVDLVNLFTLHVRCFYLVAARLHAAQYSTVCSLWYLFRGRKYNELRHRVDTLHHDLEQLLLGTVLFTALVFLAPTVAFYYVCFSAIALLLAASRALMHAARHAVQALPLYSLLALRFQPHTLPHGVVFDVLARTSGDTSHMRLWSVPLPASALCHELRALVESTKREHFSGIVGMFLRGTVRERAEVRELPGGVHVKQQQKQS